MSRISELRKSSEPNIASNASAQQSVEPLPPFWRQYRFRMGAMIVAGLVVVAVGANWLMDRWSHVALDDARIVANLVTVSSEVSGHVSNVPVVGGDTVVKGALLVGIDSDQAELDLAALDAQIAATSAQQDQLRAQQMMIRTQLSRKLAAGRAQVAESEPAHKTAEAVLQNARNHFQRFQALAAREVVSKQDLEQAQADLTSAEQQERSTAAGITAARANLAVTAADESEIEVLDRQIATLEAQKSAQVAARDRKKIDLAHFNVAAKFDGVIDSTFVDAGEYVSPGTRLLIYHDPNSVWVDANVKETDFQRLKIGAPVSISVDAYPGRVFEGKVVRLGEAATSQFALLPSPNPSGNFTKVTQRLPIRISIEQQGGILRPGMMAEANIDVLD